jgi:acyl-CoA thioesterase
MLATKIARPMTAEPIFHSASDGVFEPTGHARGPWDADALHGGAPAALLARAVEGLESGLALGRLTIDYLGPVPLAPLTVVAAVVRPGRRFAVAEATVEADGRRCCFARAVLVRRAPVELPEHWEPEPARMPAPEEGRSSPFPVEGAAGTEDAFHRSVFDIRFVAGDYGRGPADVWFRLRRPLVDASPATPLEALAAVADFGNGVSHLLDFERFVFINLDLSIQVLRPPRGEWIGLAARTELSDDGTGVARSTLHDHDGAVGSAAQTLFVAPR